MVAFTVGYFVSSPLRWRAALVAATLGVLAHSSAALANCEDKPGPGVDWAGCSKELLVLEGSDLSGSNFEGTFLSGSSMKSANLAGANFQGSELARASFSGADLSGATFEKALASPADFSGAILTK